MSDVPHLPIPRNTPVPWRRPLSHLQPEHKRILALRLQGNKTAEIARALNIPPARVYLVLNNPTTRALMERAHKDSGDYLHTLFEKAVDAVRSGLEHEDPDVYLKAADLLFKAVRQYADGGRGEGRETAEDVVRRVMEIKSEGPVSVRVAEEEMRK